jgi:hypothetical protein
VQPVLAEQSRTRKRIPAAARGMSASLFYLLQRIIFNLLYLLYLLYLLFALIFRGLQCAE